MVRMVSRDELLEVQRRGGQVVEVLPEEEYRWRHIAGAVNVPLTELTAERAAAALDRDRPVAVYCNDFQ
jgi:phage shock protein E